VDHHIRLTPPPIGRGLLPGNAFLSPAPLSVTVLSTVLSSAELTAFRLG
jgi:hypothetical protein